MGAGGNQRRKALPYHASQAIDEALMIARSDIGEQIREAKKLLSEKDIHGLKTAIANIEKLAIRIELTLNGIYTQDPPDEMVLLNRQYWMLWLDMLDSMISDSVSHGTLSLAIKEKRAALLRNGN